jgi:hypothetical protein
MRATLWAVAFSRLLDRRLIESFNERNLNTRNTRPAFILLVRSGSNASIQPRAAHATLIITTALAASRPAIDC